MDPNTIKALIEAMRASDLSEMEFSEDGWALRLVRYSNATAAPPSPAPPPARARRTSPAISAKAAALAGGTVVSPMFGIVHLKPSPEAADFVRAGATVEVGTILCTIEAMKVFNEIKADRSGTILSIDVRSGDEVETGQILMTLV